jgi:hypothetical protein
MHGERVVITLAAGRDPITERPVNSTVDKCWRVLDAERGTGKRGTEDRFAAGCLDWDAGGVQFTDDGTPGAPRRGRDRSTAPCPRPDDARRRG